MERDGASYIGIHVCDVQSAVSPHRSMGVNLWYENGFWMN
jgi:hypothetical protein